MSEAGSVPPGWYPDPMGRFDHRYWNGTAWTDSVSRQGIQYDDPVQGPTKVESAPEEDQAVAPEDEPTPSSPPAEAPERKGITNRHIVIAGLAFVVFVGVVFGVAQLTKDDAKPGPLQIDTAYEGCRQEIERRGGSAPDNFTDPGVTYEMRPRPDNGFVFTVPGVKFGEGSYRCAALDQHDGTAVFAAREIP